MIIRAEIKIDEFSIMPNHLHGIVFIDNKEYKSKNDQPVVLAVPKNKSIGSLVAGFKSSVKEESMKYEEYR